MAGRICTASIIGLDAHLVDVEADISPGLGAFLIVGLPDAAVQEARERVKSSMKHANLPFPRTRVIINLAPGDLRKTGTAFDLSIALAVLVADGFIKIEANAPPRLCIGELSLDGKLRRISGALSIAILAKQIGAAELILPMENAAEAALVPGVVVRGAETLQDVVEHLQQTKELSSIPPRAIEIPTEVKGFPDMAYVRGQEQAKRALEIAAAGGHNILLQGPPGSGKTLLAKSFPGILPRMTVQEVLEATRVHSVGGRLPDTGYVAVRPFRSPHHTASGVALVGGGSIPKPGEVSFAHRGVLFLDEFPEFSRNVLEDLRQPLEDGSVTVSRVQGTTQFPARFLLVAAMNPCPCGYATDPDRQCLCTPAMIQKYRKRISGPLLDRIDLSIEVPKVPTAKLADIEPGEPSSTFRARVQIARDIQTERYRGTTMVTNTELSGDSLRRFASPTEEARTFLQQAIDKFRLSARAYFRTLKVSRTIADLAGAETIELAHIAEALQYRQVGE